MSAFNIEANKSSPDIYLELFDFDSTMLFDQNNNPGTIEHYTNTPVGDEVSKVIWRSNIYYPLPIEISGIDNRGDGSAPGKVTIGLANVNKFLLAAILKYGDLLGMKVTRWRTFYKFTDLGETPNSLMHFPIQQWVVTRKVSQSRAGIGFEMSSHLDRPGLRIPRMQILRDKGFPGVGRTRPR